MGTANRDDVDGRIGQMWVEHRPFLVDLAFRMMGNISDAEDVVQDAFTRLLRAELDEISDVRGWLVVVVTRLCLDVLRSARSRRETHPGSVEDTMGGAVSGREAIDPADRVTLDDGVRMALLVVLEKLTPAERAVFVLHDVFRFPFATIAATVGRSTVSCRQLAARARRRVQTETDPSRFAVEPDDHRLVADRFIAACAGGDLDALMRLLDADVAGQVDLGDGIPPAPIQRGRRRVGRNLLSYFGGECGVTLVSQPLNGGPGLLAFKDGRLYALVALGMRGGVIGEIDAIRDPRKLALVSGTVEYRT